MKQLTTSRNTQFFKLFLKIATNCFKISVSFKAVPDFFHFLFSLSQVLHEVDFNQLKIENSQYLEKIDERNQDLLCLKLKATNVLQVLNTYKEKLHVLTMESDRLNSEINQRKDLLRKIDLEGELVEVGLKNYLLTGNFTKMNLR